MDHTPGQRQFVSVDKYRDYYQGKYGLSDAQMDELIASRLADQAAVRRAPPRRDHPAVPGARAHAGQPRRRHARPTSRRRPRPGRRSPSSRPRSRPPAPPRAYGLAILAGAPNLVLRRLALRATSRRPTWRGTICSTSCPPTTCRPALLHGAFLLHARLDPAAGGDRQRDGDPGRAGGARRPWRHRAGLRADLVRVRVMGLPVVRAVWRGGRRVVRPTIHRSSSSGNASPDHQGHEGPDVIELLGSAFAGRARDAAPRVCAARGRRPDAGPSRSRGAARTDRRRHGTPGPGRGTSLGEPRPLDAGQRVGSAGCAGWSIPGRLVAHRSLFWNALAPAGVRALGGLLRSRRRDRDAVRTALERVGLRGRAEEPAAGFVADRLRFRIARALVHGPEHLVVREPDAVLRRRSWRPSGPARHIARSSDSG